MKEHMIQARNHGNRFLYKILKQIFFQIDPETVHDRMVSAGQFFGSNTVARSVTSAAFSYSNKVLEQEILGIRFANPIGLAAGFDKDAQLTDILPCVGFGFEEVGSITGRPCKGNAKPRLWRLKKSRGLVVYYGLKNQGCKAIAKSLRSKTFRLPIGTNIAKANCKETASTEAGIDDYVKAFREFTDIGDYYTINISCPNAYGGQPFTDAGRLEKLLKRISKIKTKKPIFLKISPDLTKKEVDEIIKVAYRYKIAGFICTNLTKNRDNKKIVEDNVPENGGISGKVVEDLSNAQIRYIYQKTKGRFVIIGCGGVFSAEDAYRKIKSGASLVQMITGMVFEGPQVISEINQGLVRLLERDGFSNISEVVGADSV